MPTVDGGLDMLKVNILSKSWPARLRTTRSLLSPISADAHAFAIYLWRNSNLVSLNQLQIERTLIQSCFCHWPPYGIFIFGTNEALLGFLNFQIWSCLLLGLHCKCITISVVVITILHHALPLLTRFISANKLQAFDISEGSWDQIVGKLLLNFAVLTSHGKSNEY
jgi:hypothetical protein